MYEDYRRRDGQHRNRQEKEDERYRDYRHKVRGNEDNRYEGRDFRDPSPEDNRYRRYRGNEYRDRQNSRDRHDNRDVRNRQEDYYLNYQDRNNFRDSRNRRDSRNQQNEGYHEDQRHRQIGGGKDAYCNRKGREDTRCFGCGGYGLSSHFCPCRRDACGNNSDEKNRTNSLPHVGGCRVRISNRMLLLQGCPYHENPELQDLINLQEDNYCLKCPHCQNYTGTNIEDNMIRCNQCEHYFCGFCATENMGIIEGEELQEVQQPASPPTTTTTTTTEALKTPTKTLQTPALEDTTVNTFKPAETPEAETAEAATKKTTTETVTKSTSDKEENPKEPSTVKIHKLKEEVCQLKEEVKALKQTFTDVEIIEKQKLNPENSKTRPKQPPEEDKNPEQTTNTCSEPEGAATKFANFLTALLVIIIIAMSTVTGTFNVLCHGQCNCPNKDACSEIERVTQEPIHQVYQRIHLQKELLHQKLLLHPPQEPESLPLLRERLKIQRGQRWRLRQQKGAQEEYIPSKRQTRNSPKDSAYHYDNVDNCCINGRNSELRNYPLVPSQDKKKSKGEHGVLGHLFKERNCEGKPGPARDEFHTRNLIFQKRKGRIKRRRIRLTPRSISFAERVVQKQSESSKKPKVPALTETVQKPSNPSLYRRLPILHRVMPRTNERTNERHRLEPKPRTNDQQRLRTPTTTFTESPKEQQLLLQPPLLRQQLLSHRRPTTP